MTMWLALALMQSAQPAPKPPEEVIVEGARARPHPREHLAEEPYSEREHVLLGSRIPREVGERLFTTVASNTGLAGLIDASNKSIDALGGPTRKRVVKICRTDDPRVRGSVACGLARAAGRVEENKLDEAAAEVSRLRDIRMLSDRERYAVATFDYEIADLRNDGPGRERALHALLGTGRLAPAERAAAHKTLARLTLDRGDARAAIGHTSASSRSPPAICAPRATSAFFMRRREIMNGPARAWQPPSHSPRKRASRSRRAGVITSPPRARARALSPLRARGASTLP